MYPRVMSTKILSEQYYTARPWGLPEHTRTLNECLEGTGNDGDDHGHPNPKLSLNLVQILIAMGWLTLIRFW